MRETNVMVEERRRLLLQELQRDGRVIAADAASRFGVSEDTIRRDLRALAGEGLVKRVRGGALPLAPISSPFASRLGVNQPAQTALAKAVASRLSQSGGVVVLDNGVTGLRIAEQLAVGCDLTVVTSSPAIGAAASLRGVVVLMLGGLVDPAIGASVDAQAVSSLATVRADVAVLGTCAVHPALGVTTAEPEEVAFKRAVVAAGAEVIAVITAEKLNTAAPFLVATADELTTIFTEALVDTELRAGFVELGAEIVIV